MAALAGNMHLTAHGGCVAGAVGARLLGDGGCCNKPGCRIGALCSRILALPGIVLAWSHISHCKLSFYCTVLPLHLESE